MHRSQLGGFIIDCQEGDLKSASAFWSAALGLPTKAGYDPKYVGLQTAANGLAIEVQKVDHPSRVHLDIETDDIPAEVARLEKLGATVDKRMERWVVMRAPTGQRFCVVRVQRAGFPTGATEWE